MTQLRIDAVQLSKTGKSYSVKSADKYYTCKAPGIEQAVGKTVEAVLGEYEYQGHKYITIDSFDYVKEQATGQMANWPAPAPSNGDRWWLPFVSNQVAHAIAAGLIKERKDIGAWGKAAKEAIIAIDQLEAPEYVSREPGEDDAPPF